MADLKQATSELFQRVIRGIESGELKDKIQAKCVCVDARPVTPEEVGQEHIVWSHGKVEKTVILQEGMVLITTLDEHGNPVMDESGHTNTYDMSAEKFAKRYKKHENGHYVQDLTPMATVQLSDDIIPEEGITFLPPNWGGYEGTLMRGGLIMLPYSKELTARENIDAWKTNEDSLDWYPNNETQTYAECDKNGKFKDAKLRKLFGQTPQTIK